MPAKCLELYHAVITGKIIQLGAVRAQAWRILPTGWVIPNHPETITCSVFFFTGIGDFS
jgi:hypothetical protein